MLRVLLERHQLVELSAFGIGALDLESVSLSQISSVERLELNIFSPALRTLKLLLGPVKQPLPLVLSVLD